MTEMHVTISCSRLIHTLKKSLCLRLAVCPLYVAACRDHIQLCDLDVICYVGCVYQHKGTHMSGRNKKPMYKYMYILNKVQKSRTDAVVNPTKYFRDVATLEQESLSVILCDVDFFLCFTWIDSQAGRRTE